jgi:hypothetical protein
MDARYLRELLVLPIEASLSVANRVGMDNATQLARRVALVKCDKFRVL